MQQIVLPDLFCPFAPVVNKHAALVQEETTRWASSFGLLSEERSHRAFRATAAGRLAAGFHPFAGREELRLISDFYAWMFLQDDRRDESAVGRHPGRLSDSDRRFLEVLEGDVPERHDGPAVHALGDLSERLGLLAPGPAWVRRFVRGVEKYFEASLWEAANRARGTVPDPEDYARMRPLTAGLGVDDELIELAGEARLFGGAREHPTVRRLTLASHNAVCWANDVFSLGKELAHGDVHNLVVVLAHAEGLGLQEALDRVAEVHDEEVRNFVRLSSWLPSFGEAVDEHLGSYMAVLRARIRGNLDWSRESARY